MKPPDKEKSPERLAAAPGGWGDKLVNTCLYAFNNTCRRATCQAYSKPGEGRGQ